MSNKKRIGIGLGLTAAGLLTGTAVVFMLTGPQSAVATAGPALDRPVPVEVTVVERTRMRLWSGFSARLAAVDEVLVRPQVSGKIVEVRFSDGETVNKDQVLFVIDPRPYTATVNRAKAELVAARDRHALAKKELDRARELLASKHISKQAADELESVFAVRASEVEAAAARLEQAQIDLDYAFVKAPIAGRASRAEVTLGNILQAGSDAPLLTTIVSNEGIYAEFEV
ncbi:MAG: efflux RND transporter periplasmic adaptor subunit, partial [Gammaproteobacteria bacterium]|nr:efflux RND transporter periplasmic adaptor subunit [Gammaproteobacteria bacterium]